MFVDVCVFFMSIGYPMCMHMPPQRKVLALRTLLKDNLIEPKMYMNNHGMSIRNPRWPPQQDKFNIGPYGKNI